MSAKIIGNRYTGIQVIDLVDKLLAWNNDAILDAVYVPYVSEYLSKSCYGNNHSLDNSL